jgi:hypothetical protein
LELDIDQKGKKPTTTTTTTGQKSINIEEKSSKYLKKKQ